MFLNFLSLSLFLIALSIDGFATGLSYAFKKILISRKIKLILSLICSLVVVVSLMIHQVINNYLPKSLINSLGIIILIIMGLIKLIDPLIKKPLRKLTNLIISSDNYFIKKISNFFIVILIKIYLTPEKADFDHSQSISGKEAIILGLALSMDSLIVASLAGGSIDHNHFFIYGAIYLYACLITYGLISLGKIIGNFIVKSINYDLSWLSGIILLILAISKIFKI